MGSFTQFFCVIFNAISISEYPSLSFSCGPRSHIFVYCNTSTFSTFRLLSHFNFPFFICHILSLNLRFHFSTLLNNFYIVVRRRRMEKCKKVFSVLNVVSFVKRYICSEFGFSLPQHVSSTGMLVKKSQENNAYSA